MKIVIKVILIFFLFHSQTSLQAQDAKTVKKPVPGKWLREIKVGYVADNKNYAVKVQMFFPAGYIAGADSRVVILLDEFNGSSSDWEMNTNIEKLASDYNIVLVAPSMGSTLYETSFFPETKNRWGGIPGGIFIGEVLIDYLKKNYNLAGTREKTGIMGVATGGRGALLLAGFFNTKFRAAAGIGGDYDPHSMTRDRRLISVYGEYKDNIERWEKVDNVLNMTDKYKNTAIFLWHGDKDYIVPKEQTIVLAMKLNILQRQGEGYDIKYIMKKNFARGWKYWKGAVEDAMIFFNSKLGA